MTGGIVALLGLIWLFRMARATDGTHHAALYCLPIVNVYFVARDFADFSWLWSLLCMSTPIIAVVGYFAIPFAYSLAPALGTAYTATLLGAVLYLAYVPVVTVARKNEQSTVIAVLLGLAFNYYGAFLYLAGPYLRDDPESA